MTAAGGAALATSRALRTGTLCALYTAQGIPHGFVTITLVAYLAAQGLDTTAVGEIMAFTYLPWVFKFAWGPVVDRFTWLSLGRRRPWILIAQVMMALTILAMVFIDELTANIAILSWMVFVHNCFNALQDVAVDALAVDLLEDDERGKVNGYMWASKWFGVGIGGAGMGAVMGMAGIRAALGLQVAVLLAIMLLPLMFRERLGERLLPWSAGRVVVDVASVGTQSVLGLMGLLHRAFSVRSALVGAAFMLASQVAMDSAETAATVFYTQELGWTAEQYSLTKGGWGVAMAILGALTAGLLLKFFGRRTMAAVSVILVSVVVGSMGLGETAWSSSWFPTAWLLTVLPVKSFFQVVLFAICMDLSWPRVAASQFTAYMATLNLSSVIGQKLAGPMTEALGFGPFFLVLGVANLAALIILPFVDPGETRRVLGTGEDTATSAS